MKRLGWLMYCALITMGHLLYTLVFPSIVNGERYWGTAEKILEPSYIHAFFHSRVKFGEFARRPLTTFFIQLLESAGIPLEIAFLLVLYAALFITFLLLYRLSLNLTKSDLAARWSVFLFASAFWIIHAVFSEIYAYDEPVQYVFVFASFLFLQQRKWLAFSLAFLMALVARESTALLLPGIFFYFMLKPPIFSRENFLNTLKVGWTIPAYGAILYAIIEFKGLEEKSSSYMRDVRFKHLYYSFAELDIGIDTLTSFLMAFIVPVTLLILHRRFRKNGAIGDRPWIMAAVLNVALNSVITFVFTMGRETRIFAQPMLLLMPWMGLWLITAQRGISDRLSLANWNWDQGLRWITGLLIFTCLCFAISLYAYEVYWPTDTKFFNGFQHHVYIKLTLCLGAVMLAWWPLSKGSKESSKKAWMLAVPFGLGVLLFFGNQQGYRAYDTFNPIMEELEEVTKAQGIRPELIVGTNMPNVAENYFEARKQPCIAGDFNLQLPLKQVLYHDEVLKQGRIHYLELEPAVNFPMRYILSQWGEVERNDQTQMWVNASKPATPEANQYTYSFDQQRFKTGLLNDKTEAFLREEYSPAFKFTLREMGIDSLESFAGSVEYQCDMGSEAALVVTIDDFGSNVMWEHVFLNIFLTETDGWNTAYLAKLIPTDLSQDALISFYIWNRTNDEVKWRNLQFTLNSEYLSDPKKKGHVLGSRKLK